MTQRNRSVSLQLGKSRAAALTITHPNAAGIDIGGASHFVAVPADRGDVPVREFAVSVRPPHIDIATCFRNDAGPLQAGGLRVAG